MLNGSRSASSSSSGRSGPQEYSWSQKRSTSTSLPVIYKEWLLLLTISAIFAVGFDVSLARDITQANKPTCIDYNQLAEAGVVVSLEALNHYEKCSN